MIDKSVKSVDPERRRDVPWTSQSDLIVSSLTDTITARIGPADTENDEVEAICEVAKMMTIPINSEAILTMTTKSEGTYMVEAKDELTVWTCLLISPGIVGALPDETFHVLGAKLTKKAVALPKHSRLAKLTKHPTVVVSMVEGTEPGS